MADTGTEEYIVGEGKGSACFYSRYPNGIGKSDEAYDLCCPKCGDDYIKIIAYWYPSRPMKLGDRAQCWTCKHIFDVTENCWKLRMINGN